MGPTAALLLLAMSFDSFDGPLDPLRWYVGTPAPPAQGSLRLPREGWIVSRGIPDAALSSLEIVFQERGGQLEVTFFDGREPLSRPAGPPLLVARGKGERTLVVGDAAAVDGQPQPWSGERRGTFRLRAVGGEVDLREVRVEAREATPLSFSAIERSTVHLLTTPEIWREGEAVYARTTLPLWDVEVCFLWRRGPAAMQLLRSATKGAPTLGVALSLGNGADLAAKHSGDALAMRDWNDESGHLAPAAMQAYLREEYALLDALQQAQRALNAAVPGRRNIEALVPIAMVRHADNAHAALALALLSGVRGAPEALRRALGAVDERTRTGDQIRAAAAAAAREILGDPPAEWPGFRFDPANRYITLQRCRDLLR